MGSWAYMSGLSWTWFKSHARTEAFLTTYECPDRLDPMTEELKDISRAYYARMLRARSCLSVLAFPVARTTM